MKKVLMFVADVMVGLGILSLGIFFGGRAFVSHQEVLQARNVNDEFLKDYVVTEEYFPATNAEENLEIEMHTLEPEVAEDQTEVIVVEQYPEEDYPQISVDVSGFRQVNDEMQGFLYYPSADVSYPVMLEHEDEDYYLHHNIDGCENPAGSLFSYLPIEGNTVIYGHNMKSGMMFGSLYNVMSDRTDPYFFIYDAQSVKKYRVIAAFECEYDSGCYDMPDKDDSAAYIQNALSAARYDDVVPFTEREKDAIDNGAQIISLSTCHWFVGSTHRFVVVGICVDEKLN